MQCPTLAASQGCNSVVVAPRVSFMGIVVSSGDVIFVGGDGLLVRACAALDGRLCLLVVSLVRVGNVVSHAFRYQPADDVQIFDLRINFKHALCWSREPDGSLLVLR